MLSPPPLPLSTTSSSSSSSSVSFRLCCFCYHRRRSRLLHHSSPNKRAVQTSTPCRSRSLWNKKRQLISRNHVRTCFSTRVYNSLESQETRSSGTLVEKGKLLIDCGPEQECVLGGVVALGKFDALHIGHRQLAIQAAKVGAPFLLSFVGIAEVLGWEYRAPVVAECDRKRVLSLWAPHCGDVVPQEYHVDFASVRYLSPRQFVEKLSVELGVAGVVAGENYRFGYRAAGDASDLVKLCAEYGLESFVVRSVMDEEEPICPNGATARGDVEEKVSSTRVRRALAEGNMGYVERLLGRKHRLLLEVDGKEECASLSANNALSIPKSRMLNQPPKEGLYQFCSLLVGDNLVGPCRLVLHGSENIHVQLLGEVATDFLASSDHQCIAIEFGSSP